MQRRVQRLVLLWIVGLGAVACGGAGDDDATPRATVSTVVSAPASTPASVSVTPHPSGVVRIGDFGDVTTFDPALTQFAQAGYLYPVYDTLVRQLAGGELAPHLATSWTMPDPTTWRFVLRDDVVFHDGSRFDAQTVKANLERDKNTPGNPNAPTFASIVEVVAVDPTTVDVHFAAPNPTFPLEMSMVQGMMVSRAAISSGLDLTRDPQGSGGWIWDTDASLPGAREVYEINPRYWAQELQGVERIEIDVIPDNGARFAALQAGQVDIVLRALASQIADAEDAGFAVDTQNADAHWIQVMDRDGVQVAALGDQRVRQAIAHAIDREGYVKAVLGGVGSASGGLVSPALSDWYDPGLADLPTFDPALSRQLLAEAGYADGFDVNLPTMPAIQANVEAVAQMLEAVGIRVTLIPLEAGQAGPEIRRGSFPMAVASAPQYHPQNTFGLLASSDSPYNPFHVADAASIDAALVRAAAADHVTAKGIYSDIARELIDRGVMIPIAFQPVVVISATDVTGAFVPLGVRTPLPFGLRVDG
jgi:peptide/nickel transport system substrate-binding protein